MSDNRWCKTCGDFMFGSSHRCHPRFECRIDDKHKSDRDWWEIYAVDAESAAEKFCDEFDPPNDYNILRADGHGYRIEVRAPDGAMTYWSICAESRPSYTAFEEDGPESVTDAALHRSLR